MQLLRALPSEKLEFFTPPPAATRDWISQQYVAFELSEYLQLLSETDGVGELFSEGGERFVHNMLILSAEEALAASQVEFDGKALVIGNAGVDGIRFVLQPARPEVFAYYPISEEFVAVADSVLEFLKRSVANEIRL